MDAVVYKNLEAEPDSIGRIEVVTAVPFEILRFKESNSYYKADFNIVTIILDSDDRKVYENTTYATAYAETYYDAQGGNGGFKPVANKYNVPPGKYTVSINLQDEGGKQLATNFKTVSVPDYNQYSTATSGLLLISQIEEIDGRTKITPHLSDNIYELQNGFFIFYRVYSDSITEAFVEWDIKDSEGNTIIQDDLGIINFSPDITLEKIFIKDLDSLPLDNLIFTVRLNETGIGGDIISLSERELQNFPEGGYDVLRDIDEAIERMAWVASSSEMDSIESLATERDRKRAFLAYWDNLDPTPNTRKNEAFEEYYSRIEFANNNFRSYAAGWLTDMGRVYTVLGPPDDVNSAPTMNTQWVSQVWVYNNIGTFVFQDRTGFGDFRLVRPMGFRNRYRYGDPDGD
jgi:GWxTD domain-containing protein